MTVPDPLADFPDWAWATLAEYAGTSITQVRSTLKIYIAALDAIGFEVRPAGEVPTPPRVVAPSADWPKVGEVVATVLGDVASDREMGVPISSDEEVDLVVDAVREVLEP